MEMDPTRKGSIPSLYLTMVAEGQDVGKRCRADEALDWAVWNSTWLVGRIFDFPLTS